MLIRFTVKNLFSFKEETEFNLLPGRVKRLNHHKYERNGIEVLKMTALYGANGSGKSNLIQTLSLLKTMILDGLIPNALNTQKFKLSESSKLQPVELGVEFFTNNSIYYYSISINEGIITDEYFSSIDSKQNEKLIFQRTIDKGKTSIKFFDAFEENNKELKKVIEIDLLKPYQPLFTLLNSISNNVFIDIKVAYQWFQEGLTIIFPNTKPSGLILGIENKKEFQKFATELMASCNTGIANVKVDTKNLEEFFGKDNQTQVGEIRAELKNNPKKIKAMLDPHTGEVVLMVCENDTLLAKRLLFEHRGEKNKIVEFIYGEESDGTKRLLEYLPVFVSVLHTSKTFFVDEIERSIHPLIIKELIEKFSKDESTKGQLIFSTHESNLLDQEVFRTDEIWFTEKNLLGSTKLYSLSDFKEHNTIDIRKGYLNGRYGAIPFLGNLQDLNWNKFYVEKE